MEVNRVANDCVHMFYLKVKSLDERTKLLEYLKQNVPLHSAPAGVIYYNRETSNVLWNEINSEYKRLLVLAISGQVVRENSANLMNFWRGFINIQNAIKNCSTQLESRI